MNIFRALKHGPFALIWAGQTISRLGDSLDQIALAWWVLEQTGSATAMSAVLILSTLPLLLLLLIGGAMVDRWPRLPIMLLTDLLRGFIVLAVAALAWGNLLELWHIYIASVLLGCMAAFFRPAYTAVIPELTPPEALPSANSLTELGWQFTSIAGPALGALIIARQGASVSFLMDGLTFFVAALCLIPLLKSQEPLQTSRKS